MTCMLTCNVIVVHPSFFLTLIFNNWCEDESRNLFLQSFRPFTPNFFFEIENMWCNLFNSILLYCCLPEKFMAFVLLFVINSWLLTGYILPTRLKNDQVVASVLIPHEQYCWRYCSQGAAQHCLLLFKKLASTWWFLRAYIFSA